ncbi:AI-2E family transporter [Aetokthonos hydrillicola Thurmond2011]|uniref:AI-2E family transporter n=1 Tax=Aetokthonos hydrillicola Thurmond2011 TaxID=2712845 RepID=A0AAP5IF45_9CYAN|nr:AI-2E family transporter [Aetokthonos hydrillicola]MBO3460085.1 AI-2E family transporter [Aetokthonos hydrillicola CCALA 1050]MBW4589516.1 AI-2E family transporter [Aetokthonos hydrillicola CCALA 1050]MDR9899812.1 AI-2E family transporter [Aetokthonos hydrillicola Thurmond2011]
MRNGKWIGYFALAISLYILWQIHQVLLLVFMAVVFATALNSFVRRLERSGVKRGIGIAFSLGCLAVFIVIFIGVIIPPFVDQFQQIIQLIPKGLDKLQVWFQYLQTRMPWSSKYIPGLENLLEQLQPSTVQLASRFFAFFSNILAVTLNLLLVLVLTVMFLINPLPYRQGFIQLFPGFYRRRVDEILCRCEVALVSWITGILINMLVIGVVSGIALWILGVPLVFANALLAGLLEAIPNVGPTLSVIPPMAIALLDNPWKAGAVLIAYIVIQQLEQYLLVPFVMSKQLSLLPVVTLISQVIFAIFFGFLGLFLAIPLVIVGLIWIQEVLIKDVLDRWQAN